MPIRDKDVGDTVFARTPIHLSKAPELPINSAPNLGEDTEYVLKELLGYSPEKTEKLLSNSVVDKDQVFFYGIEIELEEINMALKTIRFTKEEMNSRVARFDQLQGFDGGGARQ